MSGSRLLWLSSTMPQRALPMERSLQLLDLRESLAGTSDEVVEPLHVIRGVIFGLLWSASLWLVIIAVALWILVFAGVRY